MTKQAGKTKTKAEYEAIIKGLSLSVAALVATIVVGCVLYAYS